MKIPLVVLVLFTLVSFVRPQSIDLKPDSIVDGSVTYDHWVYYRFVIPPGKGFVLTVKHTANTNHDLDVYIQDKGQIPDRLPGNYVYKDTSASPNIVIQATAVTNETIFVAGVYGFKGDRTVYTIEYSQTAGCMNNCTGHGACIASTCVCNTGYYGANCEISLTNIISNTDYNASLRQSDWVYYMVQVSRANDISLVVTQRTGDIDVYVRYGNLPTRVAYDFANATVFSGRITFTISITNPTLGLWYIGFVGSSSTTTSSFSFRIRELKNCPMLCSTHGTCIGTRCRCNQGYTGTSCEEKIDNIALGVNYTGYVDSNYWNYYRYSSNSMLPFGVQLLSKDMADCDIYVKPDQKPTRWDFLFRNISVLANSELVVYDPGQRLWYIGIYGATACNYSMTVKSVTSCNCVNGVCVQGRCQCNAGWAGDSCDQNTANMALVSGVPSAKSTVGNGKWVYYQYYLNNSSQINVVLRETSTQGMTWLYLSAGRYPDNANYEAVDVSTSSNLKHVQLEFATPKTAVYYVGVYGGPLILSSTVEFQVVAWSTPF